MLVVHVEDSARNSFHSIGVVQGQEKNKVQRQSIFDYASDSRKWFCHMTY